MLGFEKAVGRAVLAAPPAGFGPQAGSVPPSSGHPPVQGAVLVLGTEDPVIALELGGGVSK